MWWPGHVTRIGNIRNILKTLIEKNQFQTPLGRHKRKWEDNIKMLKGEWRRLHNEELNDLYSSPNIIRVIKS
jgi:hypothetical protein